MTYVLVKGQTATAVRGNPTIDSLDGKQRAKFRSIIADGWPEGYAASFGVYKVDIEAPEGEYWTGAFEVVDGEPVAVFEAIPPPTPEAVDAERDQRITEGFEFGGTHYQTRDQDRENISGASVAALAAMMNGAQADDYRWHGGDTDFEWIATDNSTTKMDAQTMFAFGQAAMAHKQKHIFAARSLKDSDPIPTDYTDDSYWP